MSNTIGFLKGQNVARAYRDLTGHRRMTELQFWATGYCISTVGLEDEKAPQYIRDEEQLGSSHGNLDLK